MLCTLLRHSLGHRDGRDTAWLSTDNVGHLIRRTTQRIVQDELRDLSGLTAPAVDEEDKSIDHFKFSIHTLTKQVTLWL